MNIPLEDIAHALGRATVEGKAQPFPSQRQHAAFVADVAKELGLDDDTAAWFMECAKPHWVVGTHHENHWDARARSFRSKLTTK